MGKEAKRVTFYIFVVRWVDHAVSTYVTLLDKAVAGCPDDGHARSETLVYEPERTYTRAVTSPLHCAYLRNQYTVLYLDEDVKMKILYDTVIYSNMRNSGGIP